jgi:hypothetical protein
MIFRSRSEQPRQAHGVRPEEVLLQITLGFMVILGYLLSDEVSVQEPLRLHLRQTVGKNVRLDARLSQTRQERDRIKTEHAKLEGEHHRLQTEHERLDGEHGKLEGEHNKLKGEHDKLKEDVVRRLERAAREYQALMASPQARLIDERDRALRAAQRIALLNAWLKLRPERPLFRLVTILDHPDGPLTTMGADRLTSNPLFRGLRGEVDRLFRPATRPAAPAAGLDEEITSCALLCVAAAGLKPPDATTDVPDWVKRTENWKALRFFDGQADAKAGVVSEEDLRVLIGEIRTDFLGQKERIARIQFQAVTTIAEAMTVREAAAGRSANVREVLAELLDELDKEIHLLASVRARLESAR